MATEYNKETYWEILDRQKGIITKEDQVKLLNSLITVVGCGGIGGATTEMLARMGFGKLKIVDKDVFEISNINRQLMSSLESVGMPKTHVTKERLESLNPSVEVEVFNEELTDKNVLKILKGSQIVVDALDNLLTRIIISRCTEKLDIPFVHGAIHGTMGQITVFNRSTPKYEDLFKLPSHGKELTDEIVEQVSNLSKEVPPVIGPVPNIVGCLQAFEVVKIITGKGSPIMAPRVLMFDLMKEESFSVVRF
ncbi:MULTISPECIES: HesA/MoeB/ThiF family protein [Methanobacterium]|jgi:molybdopterin/thiamine biosynthesis adenylyltransferase|uniref:HesA/MoeB/ThiF family protein n=1 Tax=Methanobacterium subterraneum TaxID=59277 RepID=A0A2H4VAG3_9EURY|nr:MULTISPECIES: HesA/MoeB/ThiF family protein [Methanobacterium]MBW4256534.1 HesA/MoeB/ThiF family protein [Methanobacterium sp. YSL]PKL73772.1 MAG: molybdopterin biosynthesis protein MoeB [Methanobacteriales archaeon HGW-Methanobacteriales-2]AUB55077.1 molybdopterin biosynthesis protein MoeB [Methanobacterium subterraneum]AUB57942.1 molybdopterin biosynthesis protein MoeB [Methanobacterium sp. MZ-A1]NMO09223.1 HesA/MoeB/ThiF family protein [Methanobacterium subterraneum]